MVEITSRQKKILFTTIEEYIKTARPVSSLKLNQKYNFDISSATIRNEMVKLAKKGLLFRPYTSSGRVPTDKGYLLFIEEFMKNIKPAKELFKELEEMEINLDELIDFSQQLTSTLNKFVAGLVLNYLIEKNLLWEEGWQDILLEPEFSNRDCLRRFIKFVEETEKKIREVFLREPPGFLKVFVGKDNPILRYNDFSMIVSRIKIPKTKKGCCIIFLGPKRMHYKRHLQAIYTLFEFFEKI